MRFGRPVRSLTLVVLTGMALLWPDVAAAQSSVGGGPLTSTLPETEPTVGVLTVGRVRFAPGLTVREIGWDSNVFDEPTIESAEGGLRRRGAAGCVGVHPPAVGSDLRLRGIGAHVLQEVRERALGRARGPCARRHSSQPRAAVHRRRRDRNPRRVPMGRSTRAPIARKRSCPEAWPSISPRIRWCTGRPSRRRRLTRTRLKTAWISAGR